MTGCACVKKREDGRVLCNVYSPGGGWRVRKPPPMSTGFPLDPHWMSSTGAPGSYLPQWPAYRPLHQACLACLACPRACHSAKRKRLEEGSPAGSKELSLWSPESGQKTNIQCLPTTPRDKTGPGPPSSSSWDQKGSPAPVLLDGTDGHH